MSEEINQLISSGTNFMIVRLPGKNKYEWYSDRNNNENTVEIMPFDLNSGSSIRMCSGKPDNYNSDRKERILQHITSRSEYDENFKRLQHKLKQNELQKVILSRVKFQDSRIENLGAYFERLTAKYPETFCYLMNYNGAQWIGATPELLLLAEKDRVYSNAVAGTRPTAGQQSPWTAKEYAEHKYVVDFISESIEKYGSIKQVVGPTEKIAGQVRHLVTEISGTTDDHNQLLNKLHPTPAVCGTPTELAKKAILETEQHNREYYTGYIRLKNKTSDISYVNLRCMKIVEGYPYLFVGGGLTVDSDLESEWLETEEKARTLLSVMGKI